MNRVAAIDIGSNSIKLRLVDAASGAVTMLADTRYPIRLGTAVFNAGELSTGDIETTVSAFQEIGALCRSHGVSRARVVATSALREAANRNRLIEAVRGATGFNIEVISGAEEARLLALGVRPEMQEHVPNLVVDIGGGSTEWIYTRPDLEIDALHTIRIGAVRLQQMVKPGNPMQRKQYDQLKKCVRTILEREHLPLVARETHVLGVAGTMRAVRDIIHVHHQSVDRSFSRVELANIVRELRKLKYDDMVAIFGIDKRRAEIIIPGALILKDIMDLYGFQRVYVSTRGVRDGIIHDLLGGQTEDKRESFSIAAAVGEKYGFDRAHGEHVAHLARQLFDLLHPLHGLSSLHRETIRYAALLHDVGQYVSYSGHHKHSQYLIANEQLPGLAPLQQQLCALVARYHRKAAPSVKHPEYMALEPESRDVVLKCAAILRIADAMDQERRQLVGSVDVEITGDTVRIHARADSDVGLELSSAQKKGKLFEEVFGRRLVVDRKELRATA